ncbi:MAG: hypothetical protein KJ069_25640 [Anaerolineae bacterium]|nr:hypothetical protein [Anaerolineae bacterium]
MIALNGHLSFAHTTFTYRNLPVYHITTVNTGLPWRGVPTAPHLVCSTHTLELYAVPPPQPIWSRPCRP